MSRPARPSIPAIDYIRGISMLGVIGIHVGSQYLMNPASNPHLTAVFEVLTRFCVPIFFFVSAFGLFYHLDISARIDYRSFLQRRARVVLIPYLAWSVFYLVHDNSLYASGLPGPAAFLSYLFFGLAKYHLYFMVLLLWFYLLMPLWVFIVRRMRLRHFAPLLLLQIAFDAWSSFYTPFHIYLYSLPDGTLWKELLLYRLNYWVLHYVFIFLLGAYLAVHFERFAAFSKRKTALLGAGFFAGMIALLLYYYSLLSWQGYRQIEAINTAHQLSPAGIFYTIFASLFLFAFFLKYPLPKSLSALLKLLGAHSYFIYLAHPLAISYLSLALERGGHIMTASVALAFYLLTLLLTFALALLCRSLGDRFPWINRLSIGASPKK